jgi:hypothetical protein
LLSLLLLLLAAIAVNDIISNVVLWFIIKGGPTLTSRLVR